MAPNRSSSPNLERRLAIVFAQPVKSIVSAANKRIRGQASRSPHQRNRQNPRKDADRGIKGRIPISDFIVRLGRLGGRNEGLGGPPDHGSQPTILKQGGPDAKSSESGTKNPKDPQVKTGTRDHPDAKSKKIPTSRQNKTGTRDHPDAKSKSGSKNPTSPQNKTGTRDHPDTKIKSGPKNPTDTDPQVQTGTRDPKGPKITK
ncbi:hypothetical protein C0993_008008 [Termitomyces sp. T159_Od127]|nr:hypothetical protein C0993_008008 [Termitomyces sp. T159_Od127]